MRSGAGVELVTGCGVGRQVWSVTNTTRDFAAAARSELCRRQAYSEASQTEAALPRLLWGRCASAKNAFTSK